MSDGAMTLPPPPAGRTGGIVRRSLALAGRHGGSAGPLAFALLAPFALIGAFLRRDVLIGPLGDTGMGFGGIGAGSVGLAEGIVITPLAFAAVFAMVILALPARDALALAGGRLPVLIGAMLLAGLISVLPVAPGGVLFLVNMADALFGDAPSAGLALGGLLLAVGMPFAMFIGLSLALAVPLAAVDRQGVVASLRASWRRMRGQRLRLLGGYLALGLPASIVVMLVMLLLGALASAMGSGAGWLLIGLGDAAGNALLLVLITSVDAVVYADTAPPPAIPVDMDQPVVSPGETREP